jgi:hypothetical protein
VRQLRGRSTELGTVADGLRTVHRGRPVVVLLSGEPGIGKLDDSELFPDPWHLAFQVDDLDAFLAGAGELDVTLGPLAFDEYIPRWKTIWPRDPDGVVVEVSHGYVDQAGQ